MVNLSADQVQEANNRLAYLKNCAQTMHDMARAIDEEVDILQRMLSMASHPAGKGRSSETPPLIPEEKLDKIRRYADTAALYSNNVVPFTPKKEN